MFSASITREVAMVREAFQPTMRREKHIDDEGDVDVRLDRPLDPPRLEPGISTTPGGLPHGDLSVTVEYLNPVLRGWGNYFRTGSSARTFSRIESYVHERLASRFPLRIPTTDLGSYITRSNCPAIGH